jgi:hypothetical protein
MKNFYILSILLLLLATGQYSCKPEPTPSVDPVFTALPKDIKDYCVFKYGSYWIYQDSVSGALDTVTVQSYQFDTIDYKLEGKLIGTNETFGIVLYHSFDGYSDAIRLFAPPPPPPYNANTIFYIPITRYKQSNVLGETTYYLYPIEVNKQYINSLDTFILISKTQTEIKTLHKQHPGYSYSPVSMVYIKNVGIIRKEIKGKNQVWKLIDFHVNQ